jgi:hypothetical protein
MSIKLGTISGAVLFAFSLSLLPALAGQITELEKRNCPNDYHKFCSEYGLGSEGLRACMSRNIKKVSRACVAALVDAGEMTQAQADKLKGKGKVTKKATYKSSKPKAKSKKKKKHR